MTGYHSFLDNTRRWCYMLLAIILGSLGGACVIRAANDPNSTLRNLFSGGPQYRITNTNPNPAPQQTYMASGVFGYSSPVAAPAAPAAPVAPPAPVAPVAAPAPALIQTVQTVQRPQSPLHPSGNPMRCILQILCEYGNTIEMLPPLVLRSIERFTELSPHKQEETTSTIPFLQ